MPNNYVLLETIALTQSAASVTFDNLPTSGYTDLKVVISGREVTGTSLLFTMRINGATTNQSTRELRGNGSSATSGTNTIATIDQNGSGTTASTFGNAEVYIPNYLSANNKSFSIDSVSENNGSTAYMRLSAGLWSQTAAITSLSFYPSSGDIAANSTFSLYGIAALGTTPVLAPKATGGNIVANDGTYWYHAFTSSGNFVPQVGLTADVLVVAGGGGGGGVAISTSNYGGSGAAGGVSYLAGTSLTSTSYSITVGGGGSGGSGNAVGSTGTASNFNSSIISNGGAGGASSSASSGAGISGGSGSGGAGSATVGSATQGSTGGATGYGNAGGAGSSGAGQNSIGGSGGAGAAGGAGVQNVSGGNGGSGLNTWSSWMTTTGIGVSGYIAGGGAGFLQNGTAIGTSNAGAGVPAAGGGSAATVNTGSGGGGSIYLSGSSTGGTGGSGIILIRYPIN